MVVLVTGASGFMGTAICRALRARGNEVVALNSRNCDLTSPTSLEAYSDVPCNQIYHLAAWTQAGDFCLRHPGEQWIINQQINTNMLAWWQSRQPQAKLIAIGSSCVYDPAVELAEGNYLTGVPIDSLFAYGMTKKMLYAGLVALNRQYGMKYLCLVPSTLFGPGYHTDDRQLHFIFDIIRKVVRGKTFGEPVVLWGDGTQSRELIYIDDFVRLAVSLADRCENDIYNLGSGEGHTIRDFAAMVCERVGYPFEHVQFDSTRYVGAKSKTLVVKKLHDALGQVTFTPLKEALDNTVCWFLQSSGSIPPA